MRVPAIFAPVYLGQVLLPILPFRQLSLKHSHIALEGFPKCYELIPCCPI